MHGVYPFRIRYTAQQFERKRPFAWSESSSFLDNCLLVAPDVTEFVVHLVTRSDSASLCIKQKGHEEHMATALMTILVRSESTRVFSAITAT